jgi:hypothetical protein
MTKLRQPLHDHTCLFCRGNFPCWELSCTLSTGIVCDDCAEEKQEAEINRHPQFVS